MLLESYYAAIDLKKSFFRTSHSINLSPNTRVQYSKRQSNVWKLVTMVKKLNRLIFSVHTKSQTV